MADLAAALAVSPSAAPSAASDNAVPATATGADLRRARASHRVSTTPHARETRVQFYAAPAPAAPVADLAAVMLTAVRTAAPTVDVPAAALPATATTPPQALFAVLYTSGVAAEI